MDKLKCMAAFVASADHGSFTLAADALGVTPQYIAKQVAELESSLNLKLIHRSTRRQHISRLGELYLAQCRQILAHVENADLIALSESSVAQGKLRISAPFNYGAYRLMPYLTEYLNCNPHCQIELELTDRFVDLVKEGFDVVFRLGPLKHLPSGLQYRNLSKFRMIACASPYYLETHGRPEHPCDLADHACIGYVFPDRTSDDIWSFEKDGIVYPVKINTRFRVNSTVAKVNAALCHQGVTICSEDNIAACIERGELVGLFPSYQGPVYTAALLYLDQNPNSLKIANFVGGAIKALG